MGARDKGELEIVAGQGSPIEIELVDDTDAMEDLSSASAATLSVKDRRSDPTHVLFFDTTTGDLVIDAANGLLVATITELESEALDAGTYIGQAAVEFADGWVFSREFFVFVRAAVTETLV